MTDNPAVLITGASSGIGAVYADRFAARGHDLVLVGRHAERLEQVAARIRFTHGVGVEAIVSDLADPPDLERIADRISSDARIGILINNAGIAMPGNIADQSPVDVERLIAVNVMAVARLAQAAAHRFAQQRSGSIVSISSVVGLMPEFGQAIYAASKSFVTTLSLAMAADLHDRGVHVQAVLPAGTATHLWERSGADLASLPQLMDVDVLVDAAMAGFDMRETITIPVLPDAALWDSYDAARKAMLVHFGGVDAAARYLKG